MIIEELDGLLSRTESCVVENFFRLVPWNPKGREPLHFLPQRGLCFGCLPPGLPVRIACWLDLRETRLDVADGKHDGGSPCENPDLALLHACHVEAAFRGPQLNQLRRQRGKRRRVACAVPDRLEVT